MLPFLIFLGIAVPATELFLLVMISYWIGFLYTLGIIVVTGVIGALLWRWQGFGVLGRFRAGFSASILQQMAGGDGTKSSNAPESPLDAMFDGAMIFFAGGLLLTPGVITDFVGFALLIPFTRTFVKKMAMRSLKKRFQVFDFSSQMPGMPFGPTDANDDYDEEDIIEGEIVARWSDEEKLTDKFNPDK